MTETNLLQELEEDHQRQRLQALWQRYGAIVISAAAALVLGTAIYSWWNGSRQQAQEEASAAFMTALNQAAKKSDDAVTVLQDFAAKTDQAGLATLARLRAAAAAKDAARITAYETLANDAKVEPLFRDYALLMAVQAQMDQGDPKVLLERLQPLLEKSVWRYSAKEFAAHLALKAGDMARAKDYFTLLAQDASTPQAIATRAKDMTRYLNSK